jgi:tetratricopeptide (TPR) repeat protein
MARKKRKFVEPEIPVNEPKHKKPYRDEFQKNVGAKVNEFGKKFEGKGKTIMYALAALAVLVLLIGIYSVWNRRTNNAAQTALGKAIETSQAQVTESPLPAVSTQKTFKTEKERAEAAINEFQAVVDKFGNPYQEKAKYFIAVNKLSIDRAAAISELEALAGSSGEVGKLSKFALAQAKAGDGKLDEAAALYQELAGIDDPIVAKDTINFELAQIYQKQGKTEEATNLYFQIAKTASEAKDAEGKAIPMTQTANDAKAKLEELNPEKAKEIVEPTPEMPLGLG